MEVKNMIKKFKTISEILQFNFTLFKNQGPVSVSGTLFTRVGSSLLGWDPFHQVGILLTRVSDPV